MGNEASHGPRQNSGLSSRQESGLSSEFNFQDVIQNVLKSNVVQSNSSSRRSSASSSPSSLANFLAEWIPWGSSSSNSLGIPQLKLGFLQLKLGDGVSGAVLQIDGLSNSDEKMALKTLKKDPSCLSAVNGELFSLKNFCSFYSPLIIDVSESPSEAFITMEKAHGGELFQLQNSGGAVNGSLPEPLVVVLAYQMIEAINHFHHQNLLHRDIKLENFLLIDKTAVDSFIGQWNQYLSQFFHSSRPSAAKDNVGVVSKSEDKLSATDSYATPQDVKSNKSSSSRLCSNFLESLDLRMIPKLLLIDFGHSRTLECSKMDSGIESGPSGDSESLSVCAIPTFPLQQNLSSSSPSDNSDSRNKSDSNNNSNEIPQLIIKLASVSKIQNFDFLNQRKNDVSTSSAAPSIPPSQNHSNLPTPRPGVLMSLHSNSQQHGYLDFGTLSYAAPELVDPVECEAGLESEAWALGCCIFRLVASRPPFFGRSEKQLASQIKRGNLEMEGPLWSALSTELKDLIRKLLTRDVTQRISVSESLFHPVFDILRARFSSYAFSQLSKPLADLDTPSITSSEERSLALIIVNLFDFLSKINDPGPFLTAVLLSNFTPRRCTGWASAVFRIFDSNCRGFIEASEFVSVLIKLSDNRIAKQSAVDIFHNIIFKFQSLKLILLNNNTDSEQVASKESSPESFENVIVKPLLSVPTSNSFQKDRNLNSIRHSNGSSPALNKPSTYSLVTNTSGSTLSPTEDTRRRSSLLSDRSYVSAFTIQQLGIPGFNMFVSPKIEQKYKPEEEYQVNTSLSSGNLNSQNENKDEQLLKENKITKFKIQFDDQKGLNSNFTHLTFNDFLAALIFIMPEKSLYRSKRMSFSALHRLAVKFSEMKLIISCGDTLGDFSVSSDDYKEFDRFVNSALQCDFKLDWDPWTDHFS